MAKKKKAGAAETGTNIEAGDCGRASGSLSPALPVSLCKLPVAKIAEGLAGLIVPIDTLVLDPANARKHPDKNIEAVKASLRVYGQRKPIVVNKNGMVVEAGNGTLQAARALGWTKIAAVLVEDDAATAAGFAIADNRTAELAEWDDEKLKSLLAELKVDDAALQAMLDEMKPDEGKKGKEHEPDLERQFSILIRCNDEDDQKAMLGELGRHGLNVRAMVVDYPVKVEKAATPGPELADGEIEIVRRVGIERTPRVMQLEGLFDVPPAEQMEQRWRVKCQLDRPWNIGLIVGPSGSGKSTLARELFGSDLSASWAWDEGRALVDNFPGGMGIAEITGLLSSVGFSSPPSWLKPFQVLSNGEQFRANLARTLAEQPELAVVDEFTSVVDRTVAQVASAALAKAVRGGGRKFIAVSCHHDIDEWLQPDWKIEMPAGALVWRSLRRRPALSLSIQRTDGGRWEEFRQHHYLNHELHKGAQCFLGTVNGRAAAFTAVLYYPNAQGGFWREHRTVCLPDFQGVGIGNAMSELVAGMFIATGKSYRSVTSHPAMIRHRLRSMDWFCDRKPSLNNASNGQACRAAAVYRYTASFEFIGKARPREARDLGVLAK